MPTLVLVTGPPGSGKTTLAVPLARLPHMPAAVAEAPFEPVSAPYLLAGGDLPIQVFCRCPPDEVLRRFLARASQRHPGHLDHQTADEVRAKLERGMGPLALGGPVLEVDTGGAVDVEAVANWVLAQRSAAGACQT